MAAKTFTFQPRWKEELVVTTERGAFVLELTMGVPHVFLPTEDEWRRRAPYWAAGLWPVLQFELRDWCRQHDVRFEIEPSADVYLP